MLHFGGVSGFAYNFLLLEFLLTIYDNGMSYQLGLSSISVQWVCGVFAVV